MLVLAGVAALAAPGAFVVARAGEQGDVRAKQGPGVTPNPIDWPDVPEQTNDGPIRFVELSNASAGPFDFGNPRSDVEKSTGAFFDADGDGWDDFVTLTGAGLPSVYWLNRPVDDTTRGTAADLNGRTFVPAPAANGLDDGPAFDRDGASLTVGDVDNDGDEDIYIGCGFNDTLPAGAGRNILLLNDGTGRFTDVAPALGLEDGDNTTAAALFFDMDNDGDLDLLSCNTDFGEAGKAGDGVAHLFRNTLAETGTLGFVDETQDRGIVEQGTAVWAVLAPDYDNDGDADLLISHDIGGLTQLFRNDGTGHFRDVTSSSGSGVGDDRRPSTFGDDTTAAMGTSVGDTDRDGDLDLYVADAAGNSFYVNQGDGTFTQLATTLGCKGGTVAWGVSFADYDLDGHLDVYVAGGDFWNMSRSHVRAWMFRNDGTGAFTDVWGGAGFRHDAPLHRENGTFTADVDLDGRPDLIVTRAERAGASPYFYHNVSDTTGRRWAQIKLVGDGVATNTSAIGAKVRVYPRDAAGALIPDIVYLREVEGGEGRSSRPSLVQHVGLGAGVSSIDVEVEWPRAGDLASRRVRYERLAVDAKLVIQEHQPVTKAAVGLDPEASAVVPDAAETIVPCVGQGLGDPLLGLEVTSGPQWVSLGPWQEGRTVLVAPPRVDAPTDFAAALRATPPGDPASATDQTLAIRVVPAPRISSGAVQSRTFLRIDGDHLDLAGLVYTLNGAPLKTPRTRRVPLKDGTSTDRFRIRLPRALRRAPRSAEITLTVTEPVAGFSATWTR